MRVSSIKIKGFRNLKDTELYFSDLVSLHSFLGANGQGKTNFLEAIYLSSFSKSFRTRTATDLICFEEDFLSIKLNTEDVQLELIISSNPSKKVFKVNGVKKSVIDFIGHLKLVFFSPDDLIHLSYTPKLRRRYLDLMLSQLKSDYLIQLMEYNEACKQRNSLLKAIYDGKSKLDELDFWDAKLAQLAFYIIQSRIELIGDLQNLLVEHYQKISQSSDVIELIYKTEFITSSIQDILKAYETNRKRDLIMGQTTIGPHRDDLQFFINSKDMAFFSSRGEWRSLILALKFSEITLIKKRTGETPILLLDDVFSELDADRQKYLFRACEGVQTFISTTHKEFVDSIPIENELFYLDNGVIVLFE